MPRQPDSPRRRSSDLGAGCRGVTRIIRVSFGFKGVERVSVIGRKRKSFSNPPWKVRIRDEIAAERYRVSASAPNRFRCGVWFKPTVCDEFSFEDFSRVPGSHVRLVHFNQERSAHARLDDVQVSKPEVIQAFSDVSM